MKEIVVISGKGGTGKTSLAASLARLAGNVVREIGCQKLDNPDTVLDGALSPQGDFLGQVAPVPEPSGSDDGRRDAVDRDIVGCQLLGQSPRVIDDSRLGRAVGVIVVSYGETQERRHGHDLSRFLFLEIGSS